LVSAKTGYGVEDLITKIYMKWVGPRGVLRSDIYVIGCTNAGKSTLFNLFLQSDLCKVRALDLVERVTTSIWPGTTMSLLKFPLMNPTPYKLELRKRRLLTLQAWKKKELRLLKASLYDPGEFGHATLQNYIGNSFKENLDIETQNMTKKSTLTLNSTEFTTGNWCFDTPGTVNDQQVLNLFTLAELINVIPRSTLLPRIFVLNPGETLLIGAVGRIDLLKSSTKHALNSSVFFTVFASNRLKINVIQTTKVEEFLNNFAGNSLLGAPIGDFRRLNIFPKLEGHIFNYQNEIISNSQGSLDIILSSIGWIMLTSRAYFIKLKAWTPAGKGVLKRQPPLIPFSINYRGSRIPGSNAYKLISPERLEKFLNQRSKNIRNYGNFDFEGND